jgi:hypothetical protein
MTSEDFEKSLREQNVSMETLREEARKDLAIANLQDKYSGKISISDKEVEDFYNNNRQQFVNARGVALAMIAVDPADNSGSGIADDAKNEADAKLKIDSIYQQLQAKWISRQLREQRARTSTRSLAEATLALPLKEDLKNNSFPPELVARFFGPMQVGEYTEPIRFNSGKWYISSSQRSDWKHKT